MTGEIAEALELLRALYRAGADPADIADRARRVLPFRHPGQDRSRRARRRGDRRGRARARAGEFAERLTMGALTRAWQILINGRRGREGFAAPARLRRDGADPPRLRGRSAGAGGRAAQARRGTEGAPRRAPPLPTGRPPRGAGRAARLRRSRACGARRAGASACRRAAACALRGRGGARARQARHPARSGAGARRAARPVRAGPHRVLAGRGRLVRRSPRRSAKRLRTGPASAGWSRWCRARPRRRCARPAASARPRTHERRGRAPAGAQGAGAVPGRADRRGAGARSAAPPPAAGRRPTTTSATPTPSPLPTTTSERGETPWTSWG